MSKTVRTSAIDTLRGVKWATLRMSQRLGLYDIVGRSRWREQRLLILCYHSFARDEEHLWKPALYMQPQLFEARMEAVRRNRCTVLPLAEAIERLYRNDLPPRSVVLTFDDGTVDYFSVAHPILESYGFPSTVYLTTYYCDHRVPVFHLMCRYLLWKGRGASVNLEEVVGTPAVFDLGTQANRLRALRAITDFTTREKLGALEQDEVAGRLAAALGIDYAEMRERRLLEVMAPREVAELANRGVDFQLHTHRHRSPRDQRLYQRELHDNRVSIERIIDARPRHFCYPRGRYEADFLPWLREEGVITATTCDWGLATPSSDPLLLPRLVDTNTLPEVVFEGWLTGLSEWVTRRRQRPSTVSS